MVNENIIDERAVLSRLAQGFEDAFEEIYRQYSARLYFKLLKIVKSKIFADEIMQDVFITVWEKRSNIDSSKCFQSYINCIAVNKCYDHFRKIARDKKMKKKFLNDNTLPLLESEPGATANRESAITTMIEKLPPKRRMIFKMCKIDGKTYEEVSSQLGISPSTISDHIVKANLFIKKQVSRAVC
ncbi:MAG: sigma-70 family RNA polymerase sigma factor [Chitinophagaceae bacterium]|nr:sigma-70 family RNA polymerase sigma factor [Chitinophagaceae bacterium]